MKLSTSSNIVFDRPEGPFFHIDRMMRYAKEAGFDTLDISFYDWALPGSPFLTDEWKKWIDQVAEEKERLGMRFGQSHAYTYNFLSPALTPEERKHHEELTLRSIECCYILGSRLCVTHPDTVYDSPRPMAVSEEKNAEYFRELLDKTARFDMAFAVENMCDITIAPKRKFGAYPEELVNLAKRVGDSRFGICWDFEAIIPSAIDQADIHDFPAYLDSLELTEAVPGLVPDSTFFCLDKERNILVGAINIRHYLNDHLLKFGGHIGDGVRPSERRKGIATRMIALGLEECKKLGITRVLMTCKKENTGSAKSIMNNGGILENEIEKEDGTVMQRYWITL